MIYYWKKKTLNTSSSCCQYAALQTATQGHDVNIPQCRSLWVEGCFASFTPRRSYNTFFSKFFILFFGNYVIPFINIDSVRVSFNLINTQHPANLSFFRWFIDVLCWLGFGVRVSFRRHDTRVKNNVNINLISENLEIKNSGF